MKKVYSIGITIAVIFILILSVAMNAEASKTNLDKPKKLKGSDEDVNVIVTLKDISTDANIQKVNDALNKKGGQLKVKIKGSIEWNEVYPEGFSATIKYKDIEKLLEDPLVIRVDIDKEIKIQMETANYWSGVKKAITTYGVTGDRDGSAHRYSKTDVVIAIIDTGIDVKHKDLTGLNNGGTAKVIGWKDVIGDESGVIHNTPYDDQGHGTHVAGIAAGDGDANPKYKGVAPGAALVGVKALNYQGSGSSSGIISGINWIVANKATYGIKILSMSLGSGGTSDGKDPESVAVNRAVDQGIVTVIAAGNSGPAKYTIGSPGAAAKVITVGNIADPGYINSILPAGNSLDDIDTKDANISWQSSEDDNGFYLTPSSSRGPTADGRIKPDVVAPGNTIMAAECYPDPISGSCNSLIATSYHGGYVEKTGTSMATPFVAGVVALMLDANYSLTPTQIKNTLRSTAEEYGVSGCDIDYGCGRLRAYKAIGWAKTKAVPATDQVVPTHIRTSLFLNGTTSRHVFSVPITNAYYPFASTLIMLDWSGPSHYPFQYCCGVDFDLYAIAPGASSAEGWSELDSRQETVILYPDTTGTYKVLVNKYMGDGRYSLDISKK